MIRPIIIYGDPILKEVSIEVQKGSKLDIQALIEDMYETMHKAKGVGLAAVQLGIPLKVFVIDANIEIEDEDNLVFRKSFINPNIIREFGNEVKFPEGCLSVPGLAAPVDRKSNIEIEWFDENWEYHKEVFTGFTARMIQHEYDHLLGKIYTDRLDNMWTEVIGPSLKNIENKEIQIPYLWK